MTRPLRRLLMLLAYCCLWPGRAVCDPLTLYTCLLGAQTEIEIDMCFEYTLSSDATELIARDLSGVITLLTDHKLRRLADHFAPPSSQQLAAILNAFNLLPNAERRKLLVLLSGQDQIDVTEFFNRIDLVTLDAITTTELSKVMSKIDWQKVEPSKLTALQTNIAAGESAHYLRWQWVLAAADLLSFKDHVNSLRSAGPNSWSVKGCITGTIAAAVCRFAIAKYYEANPMLISLLLTPTVGFLGYKFAENASFKSSRRSTVALLHQVSKYAHALDAPIDSSFVVAYHHTARLLVETLSDPKAVELTKHGLHDALDHFLSLAARFNTAIDGQPSVLAKLRSIHKVIKKTQASRSVRRQLTICQRLLVSR